MLFPALSSGSTLDADGIPVPSGLGAGDQQMRATFTEVAQSAQPIRGLLGTLFTRVSAHAPITDDRPYLEGSGLNQSLSKVGSVVGSLYGVLMLAL